MPEEISNKYISLYEATKYCRYSQEYLSLRVRQGKLRAVKIGRNWVTTKEWIEEYIAKVEWYNGEKSIVRITEKREPYLERKQVLPPDNLPVEFLGSTSLGQGPLVPVPNFSEIKSQDLVPAQPLAVRFAFLFALAFLLIFSGVIFGKDSFKIVFETLDPYSTEINESANRFFVYYGKSFSNVLEAAEAKEVMGKTLKDYFSWVGENLKPISQKIVSSYLIANEFLGRKFHQSYEAISQLWKKPKEGLVVIPSTGKDEEVIKKIKESFSDEVKVEPKDKTSGIIIPVFREGEGEKYLYMLVPIRN